MSHCIERAPYLRLVQPPPPPAARRYLTRISVATTCVPIGRSRQFNLTEEDIGALLEAATRMEARAT